MCSGYCQIRKCLGLGRLIHLQILVVGLNKYTTRLCLRWYCDGAWFKQRYVDRIILNLPVRNGSLDVCSSDSGELSLWGVTFISQTKMKIY